MGSQEARQKGRAITLKKKEAGWNNRGEQALWIQELHSSGHFRESLRMLVSIPKPQLESNTLGLKGDAASTAPYKFLSPNSGWRRGDKCLLGQLLR